MKIFITLEDIIIIGIILLILAYAIISPIVSEVKKIGKHNCYKCKHYKLYDVTSVGGYCRMKCTKYNRLDNTTEIMDNEHYERCKDFEEEE